ncbi:ribonuclease H-like domain-containing protein [Tanacetum coccineum]
MTGVVLTAPLAILLSDKLMAITNLTTRVPVLLDVDEMNYSPWMYFFQNLFKGYNLLDHILGKPKTTDDSSSGLRSMKLGDLSIDAYFRKIESIATILSSLGSPISNGDVVNIALDGLPDKYHYVSDIIIHRDPFPDLKTVCSMLTTVEMRLKSRAQATYVDSTSSSPMVLLANSGTNTRCSTPTEKDPTPGNWNMDTGVSFHLNDFVSSLSDVFNSCIYLSVSVGDEHSTPHQTLPLNNVLISPNIVKNLNSVHQFVRDNSCTIEFDAFDFSVKDFLTRRVLLRCDSIGDLYVVTNPSTIPHAFLFSQYTWHQHLGHPGSYNALIKNDTWTLVPQRTYANIVRCMWLVRHKYLEEGTLSRHKARLVANGSLATSRHWLVHQLDVKNAILHGDLSETVYMHQPPGFRDSSHRDYVCLLQRSLYRLKQASRAWFQRFAAYITRILLGCSYLRGKYVVEILERAHMFNCNPSRTPVDTESKLGDDVQQICLYMHDLREPYFSDLKRILRYVRGTLDDGLQHHLQHYWLLTRMRIGLAALLLGDFRVEAENRGVANAVAETCWLRNLLHELHTPLSSGMLVYCDNVSATYSSSNLVQHQRTKHIEIDIHFARDLVVVGQVRVLHVPSRFQYADIFTKGLLRCCLRSFVPI